MRPPRVTSHITKRWTGNKPLMLSYALRGWVRRRRAIVPRRWTPQLDADFALNPYGAMARSTAEAIYAPGDWGDDSSLSADDNVVRSPNTGTRSHSQRATTSETSIPKNSATAP